MSVPAYCRFRARRTLALDTNAALLGKWLTSWKGARRGTPPYSALALGANAGALGLPLGLPLGLAAPLPSPAGNWEGEPAAWPRPSGDMWPNTDSGPAPDASNASVSVMRMFHASACTALSGGSTCAPRSFAAAPAVASWEWHSGQRG